MRVFWWLMTLILMRASFGSSLMRQGRTSGRTGVMRLMAYRVYAPDGSSRIFVPRLYPISHDNLNLDPLICHVRLEKDYNTISDGIREELREFGEIPKEYIDELRAFGGVYYSSKEVEKPRRLQDDDGEAPAARKDAYLRVHLNPRRYPAALSMTWDRILLENEEMIVVDKMEGVPTTETVDNLLESLRGQLYHRHLGYHWSSSPSQRLEVASRLDACTQGLVVFAKMDKSRDLIGRLNKAFRERKVVKKYRLRCRRKPEIIEGKVTHWYKKGSTPSILYSTNDESNNLKRAELEILSAEESEVINEETGEPFWLVEVLLLTGLTHQIRLQFAALNSAINRDHRYIPAEGMVIDPRSGQDEGFQLGATVSGGIDLQCASLAFPEGSIKSDSTVQFTAPAPEWWR